jgi:hypothetical protein
VSFGVGVSRSRTLSTAVRTTTTQARLTLTRTVWVHAGRFERLAQQPEGGLGLVSGEWLVRRLQALPVSDHLGPVCHPVLVERHRGGGASARVEDRLRCVLPPAPRFNRMHQRRRWTRGRRAASSRHVSPTTAATACTRVRPRSRKGSAEEVAPSIEEGRGRPTLREGREGPLREGGPSSLRVGLAAIVTSGWRCGSGRR